MISHRPLVGLAVLFPYLDSILFDKQQIFEQSIEIGILNVARLELVASRRILPDLDGVVCLEELFGSVERIAAVQ